MADRDPSLHILQHALGLDEYGRGTWYRNHFVTDSGGEDWELCMEHLNAGRMVRHDPSELFGGDYCFCVTDAGREYVWSNSPAPPKHTRAQKRYAAYLKSNCDMKFGEWLKMARR